MKMQPIEIPKIFFPQPNQKLGSKFWFCGLIPETWLQNDTFRVELLKKDGKKIIGTKDLELKVLWKILKVKGLRVFYDKLETEEISYFLEKAGNEVLLQIKGITHGQKFEIPLCIRGTVDKENLIFYGFKGFKKENPTSHLAKNTVREIGCCIYCGTVGSKLAREHIWPFCLTPQKSTSAFVLNDASCDKCSNITSRIENEICGKHLKDFRYFENYKSYSRYKDFNFMRTIRAIVKGIERDIEVDIRDIGWNFTLPVYGVPELLSTEENSTHGFRNIMKINIEGMRKYGIDAIPLADFSKTDFPRFLSKVAYGFGVLKYGYEKMKDSPLLPFILGKNYDKIQRFIGCSPESSFESHETGFKIHESYNEDRSIDIRLVEMKFFKGNIPTYTCIILTEAQLLTYQ